MLVFIGFHLFFFFSASSDLVAAALIFLDVLLNSCFNFTALQCS